MIADHAAEPADLVALMGEIVANVGGRRHADLVGRDVTFCGEACCSRGVDGPLDDERIGELDDEPVGLTASDRERLGTVRSHPHVKAAPSTQGNVTVRSFTIVSRPSTRSLIVRMHSDSVASDAGVRPVTRNAESPRPIPQIVRGPNISLSVAKSEAVTVQSRVMGFVTIGPTLMCDVAPSIWE